MAQRSGKTKRAATKKSAPAQARKPAKAKPAAKRAPARKAAAKPAARKAAAKPKARPAAKRPAPAPKKAVAKKPVVSKAVAIARPAAAVAKPAPPPVVARPAPAKPVVVKPTPPKPTPPKPTPPPSATPARVKAAAGRAVAKAAPSRPEPAVGAFVPDAEFLAAARRRLLAKREEIVALYRRDLRSGQESNDSPTEDIVDRANNAYTRELTYSISDSERALLLQIDEALARIDAGTYGVCVHEGNRIGRERLEAIPWARYCIESQELAEKGLLPES